MKVLNSFLFRCWQMGWLRKYDDEEHNKTKIEELEDELLNNGYTAESKKRNGKLTEAKLNGIIKKVIKRTLKESFEDRVNDMVANEKVGRQFIDFIEKYHGGVLMELIADYENGNQNGTPTSPLPTLIPEFEEAYGIECTPEMKKEITRRYNEWWYYAEPQLTDGYVENE